MLVFNHAMRTKTFALLNEGRPARPQTPDFRPQGRELDARPRRKFSGSGAQANIDASGPESPSRPGRRFQQSVAPLAD